MVDLNLQSSGFKGVIARIGGDPLLQRKLMSLGLRRGQEIAVLQRRKSGVVVSANGSRVALDASVAAHIYLEPAADDSEAGAAEVSAR